MSTAAARIALASARAAEARICAYASTGVDHAHLRNLVRQLSVALEALQRELNPPPTNREPLDSGLWLDLPAEPARVVSTSGYLRSVR